MSTELLARLAKNLTSPFFLNQNLIKIFKLLLIRHEKLLSNSKASVSQKDISHVNDLDLLKRIISAYKSTNNPELGESMWKAFFASHHNSIHQALIGDELDIVAKVFRDPKTTDLFYGFDILTKSYNKNFNSDKVRNTYAKVCFDGLVRFAESVGAIGIDNPEAWSNQVGNPFVVENVLEQIAKKCWSFSVPNPYPGEHGLETSRGVLSYRVPQALYQAWRIKQLVKDVKNPKILEIGAGLGRTAYYAYELGIKDYTIVDIPITAASQAYFLGRTLGEEFIQLEGEQCDESSQKIKILSPHTFMNEVKTYDLILNADSLTEMDDSTAKGYWEKIKSSTNIFLSINHEINRYSVKDLIADDLSIFAVSRHPSWMRKGYVEELITKKQ